MPKAAIYTRVSTDDQAKDGFSLDAQQERLAAYCEAQGWDVAGVYIDDGHSGRNTKRPAYQRMLEEKDTWDIMLVMKMDRIHRNSKNFMIMMENLEKWGKKFTSMNESLDTSNAVGRFVVDIIQRIAQLESEQIGERTYMGMRQKAETNEGLLGFNAPYGYRMECKALVLDDEEWRNARSIFDMYLSGRGLVDISRDLNSRGIKTKRGNEWTVWSVGRLLGNPIYAGHIRWDGIVSLSGHPGIITEEEYDKVQEITRKRSRKGGARHEAKLNQKVPA